MQSRVLKMLCGSAYALAWLPVSVPAQQHPADPQTATPPATYRSAYEGYRPLRDEKPASWRDANDEVARVGGHLGLFGGAHAGHGKTTPASPPASGGKK